MTDKNNALVPTEHSLKYYGWVVLAASMVGMLLSSGVMLFASIGLFVEYFEKDFGWTRPQIYMALTINTIATIISAPICGRLIDKYGAKKILIPSILIFAAIFASIPLFTFSLYAFYAIIFALGFFTVGTQSISYIRIISAWFDERRGLTIGLAASGLGLGYMVIPLIVNKVIEDASWQAAYYTLGLMVAVISFPLMALFVKDGPLSKTAAVTVTDKKPAAKPKNDQYGSTVGEAIRTREFWLLGAAILIFSFILTGIIPHIVPMMTENGFTVSTAAKVASIMGLATFVGRIGAGFLVDKFFAPYVAILFFGCATIGLLMIALGVSGGLVFLAAVLIGLGFGAESDLIGYLVSRYFGLKYFGVIYGYIYGAFLAGAGFGPLLLAYGHKFLGQYQSLMVLFTVFAVLGCLLFLLMRPFPVFDKE